MGEEFDRRYESLLQRSGPETETYTGLETLLEEALAEQEKLSAKVEALEAPASEADFHEDYLGYVNESNTLRRRVAEAVKCRDEET